MDQFVCVRMVQMYGVDLNTFKFDGNLTWAVFFLNADKTVYGRYGSRSQRNGLGEISIEGFKEAMRGALELHKGYPRNRKALAGKKGARARWPTVERIPALPYKPQLVTASDTRGCVHCHMVPDGHLKTAWVGRQPVPDKLVWTYPMPTELGLHLDTKERATVKSVDSGSPAAKAGFKTGDRITAMDGQPLISIADVQWVLHNAKEPGSLKAEVDRNGRKTTLTLKLGKGWRRGFDFSWRISAHEGDYTGILKCQDTTPQEKRNVGVSENGIALKVVRVGWGRRPCRASKAGFRKDDVIVSVDGRTTDMTVSKWIAYLVQKKRPGQNVAMTVIRGGQRKNLVLPLGPNN